MVDRPKECQGCHKRQSVRYRTIVKGAMEEVCACDKCPSIVSRIEGSCSGQGGDFTDDEQTALKCGSCGTKMSDIRSGAPMGCGECYSAFSDFIKVYLVANNRMKETEKSVIRTLEGTSLHIGKTPFETEDANLTSRLCDLKDALNEALKIENYEQAAWLRDRIKTLTEQTSEGEQQAS